MMCLVVVTNSQHLGLPLGACNGWLHTTYPSTAKNNNNYQHRYVVTPQYKRYSLRLLCSIKTSRVLAMLLCSDIQMNPGPTCQTALDGNLATALFKPVPITGDEHCFIHAINLAVSYYLHKIIPERTINSLNHKEKDYAG